MTKTLPFLLLAALAAGCDSGPGPFEVSRTKVSPGRLLVDAIGLGRVDIAGVTVARPFGREDDAPGPAPVVQAGVPFEVTVATHSGPPPCDNPAPSRVAVEGSTATVSVFDEARIYVDPTYTCPLVGVLVPRTERVVFAEPGPATVVVEGARDVFGVLEDEPYSLRFGVVVTE